MHVITFHCLVNAAHQFHNRTKNDERYILAGYPWFKCRARDQFIALPGLTLSIEEQDYFELVMETAAKGLREFMEGKPLSVKIYGWRNQTFLFVRVGYTTVMLRRLVRSVVENSHGFDS